MKYQKYKIKVEYNSIKCMRNRIVNDYENVNLSVLWGTINLPNLKDNLKDILLNEADIIF